MRTMRFSNYALAGAFMFVLLAAGCNGTITQPMQNEGTMSATFLDGTEFLAQSGTQFSITGSGSDYFIHAQDNVPSDAHFGDDISITVPVENLASYAVSSSRDNAVTVSYTEYQGNLSFSGDAAEGSCTVMITQTSPTLVGSFQAVTIGSVGDTVAISNGSFNATQQ